MCMLVLLYQVHANSLLFRVNCLTTSQPNQLRPEEYKEDSGSHDRDSTLEEVPEPRHPQDETKDNKITKDNKKSPDITSLRSVDGHLSRGAKLSPERVSCFWSMFQAPPPPPHTSISCFLKLRCKHFV